MGDAETRNDAAAPVARTCSICGVPEIGGTKVYVYNVFTKDMFLAHKSCARGYDPRFTPNTKEAFAEQAALRKAAAKANRAAVVAEQAAIREREAEALRDPEARSKAQQARRERERRLWYEAYRERREWHQRERAAEFFRSLNEHEEARRTRGKTLNEAQRDQGKTPDEVGAKKKKPVGRPRIRPSQIEPADWIAAYESADADLQAWLRYAYASPHMARSHYGTDGEFSAIYPYWDVNDEERVTGSVYRKMIRIDCGRRTPRSPALDELDEWEPQAPPNRLYRNGGG